MIAFVKYHGTGNDFIIIDDRQTRYDLKAGTIRKMCDRHFGIGADGLIQLRNKEGYDFEMLYFNSDGSPGSMCGNGGRCVAAYSHSLGLTGNIIRFTAFDGLHEAKIVSLNPYVVRLHMNDVEQIENSQEFIFMNTGSPHYISFMENIHDLDILKEGRKIRYNERFINEGVNVNFVSVKNGVLHVRTYERGVEDETLSCGTGVTASVLAADYSGKNITSGCIVHTPGGELSVYFKKEGLKFSDIWLEGKAEMVFEGTMTLIE